MKSVLVALVLVLAGTVAKAEALSMQAVGFVGLKENSFERVFVVPTATGRVLIRSSAGTETVEAKVLKDRRGTDGNLELDLGRGRKLIVSAGFTVDGVSHYTLIDGEERIELKPSVHLNYN